MALTNAQLATQQAAAYAAFHAGTITEAQLASTLESLWDQSLLQSSLPAFSKRMAEMTERYDAKWSAFETRTGKGYVALVANLPASGNSDGDWYLVGEPAVGLPNGQIYVWVVNMWVPQGMDFTQGATGTVDLDDTIFTGKTKVEGFATAVVSKTTNYLATDTDHTIKVDSTGGDRTITLMAAASVPGLELEIKKMVAANNVIVDPNGAETIDGSATVTLTTQYDVLRIRSDGTNWIKVTPISTGGGGSFTGGLLTSALGVIAGLVGTPGIYVSGDTNTGIWAPAADTLAVATGGAERTRWDSTGMKVSGLLTIDSDVIMGRVAANVSGQYNSTNAQGSRTYNTRTDSSNGEWWEIQWGSNIASLRTNKNGTGATRALRLGVGGTDYVGLDTSGNFVFVTDNTQDFGQPASGRARHIYAGSSVRAPALYVGYVAKTANFTTTAVEHTYRVDTTSGNVTATLITAVGNAGLQQTFHKLVAANTLTLDGNGSETIDGAPTIDILNIYESVTIESDGANWMIVGRGSRKGRLPKTSSQASITSPLAPNSDLYDVYVATAQAGALTINADSGNPIDGQTLLIRIKDNGSARALTWTTGSSKAYKSHTATLPTTTVAGKELVVGFIYNANSARWDCMASGSEP